MKANRPKPIELRPKARAFVEELTELSRKHGIIICGCGCWGSPFLLDMEEGQGVGGYDLSAGEDQLGWNDQVKPQAQRKE